MFNYDELTELEKELILIIGDPIKCRAYNTTTNTNIKRIGTIFNTYFKNKISEDDYINRLDLLCKKGLISYQGTIFVRRFTTDNLHSDSSQQLLQYFNEEKNSYFSNGNIQLTNSGFSITGKDVYNIIKEKQLSETESRIDTKLNELNHKEESIDKKLNILSGSLINNIESMSLFVAIFALILGNVGILPDIKSLTLKNTLAMIFAINGILISAICTLLIATKSFIIEKKEFSITSLLLYLSPVLLIGIALFLLA